MINQFGSLCLYSLSFHFNSRLWLEIIQDWLTIAPEVFVIHFESFKEDKTRELRKILDFWNYPADPDRIECLGDLEILIHKRTGKKETPEGIWPSELYARFDDAIDEAQVMLQEAGQELMPVEKYRLYGTSRRN